jgi:hypothetical protein
MLVMSKSAALVLAFVFSWAHLYAQDQKHTLRLGFAYGFGNEIKNSNFSHTNSSYKLLAYYTLKKGKNFNYELVLQPELNFATHQLFDANFIRETESDYLEKRIEYTKNRNIKEYILNIGFIVRKPISETFSVYLLGSVGPMIIEKDTERLPSGLAFSDVVALGVSFECKRLRFDVTPSFRHVSNAGLQRPNSGYNTMNLEFGFTFRL